MTVPTLLSHPDVRIGDVVVRPSTCEIVGPSGRTTLEPRVMEVLVTLLDPAGAVLSRDALCLACWGGRAVSEDAITRVISKIRRLSEGLAAGAFEIETLPKIGYRLIVHDMPADSEAVGAVSAGAASATPAVAGQRRSLPRLGVASIVVALAAVFGLAFAIWRMGQPAPAPRPTAESAADLAAKDLEMRGRAAVFEGTPSQLVRGIGYLREATVRRPGDAHAWGALAMAQMLSLAGSAPSERPAVVLRIREAASKALSLDPHEGLALAAQVSLQPTFGAWLQKDAALSRAEALAPKDTPALLFQRAQFLMAVGRNREAAAVLDRAVVGAPLLPWIQAARVQALVAGLNLDQGDRVARHAYDLWPRDPQLWLARYRLKIASGRFGEAIEMARNEANWPDGATAAEMARAVDLARTAEDPSGPRADALLRSFKSQGHDADADAMWAAVMLQRHDAALTAAERLLATPTTIEARAAGVGPFLPGERTLAPLLAESARSLWSDPRFWTLMERAGLVGVWRRRGAPDLCQEPTGKPLCQAHGLTAAPPAPGR